MRGHYIKRYIRTHIGGNFKSKSYNEIHENRDKFKEDYNIKHLMRKIPIELREEIEKDDEHDHVEYYRTKNREYVILSSPYKENDEFYREKGWEKKYNLYSEYAITYVKIKDMPRRR